MKAKDIMPDQTQPDQAQPEKIHENFKELRMDFWWHAVNELPELSLNTISFCCQHAGDLNCFGKTGSVRASMDDELNHLVREFITLWETAYYFNNPTFSTWFMRHIMWPLYYGPKLRNNLRDVLFNIQERRPIVLIKLKNLFSDEPKTT